MKRIFSTALVIALFSVASVYAQIPRLISYQGVLTDPTGKLVSDGNYSLSLSLYTSASGTSAIYNEVQQVTVVKGIFNIILGSVNPISDTLSFSRAYFLGVAINSGIELTPRTALVASPYALHASYADVAGSVAGGGGAAGVSTLNGMAGDITLVSGGSTTINKDAVNKKITISSAGGSGASGIQGVQNTDGSISVTNSSGPVATLNVAPGGIDSTKLANNSVSPNTIRAGSIDATKLANDVIPTELPPTGSAGGDLNGGYPNPNVVKLQNYNVGADLPTAGQVLAWDGPNAEWRPTTFAITLPISTTDNSASQSFFITNTGGGTAIKGAGEIGISGTSSASDGKGVVGSSANIAVYGLADNAGPNSFPAAGIGVLGTTDIAIGVAGTSSGGDGVQGVSSLSSGTGVHGIASVGSGASGVLGESTSGVGVKAAYTGGSTSANALEVDNGYIKVGGSTKTAYVHTVANANINAVAAWSSFLNYPGMASTDMVIVTHQYVGVPMRKNIGAGNFDGISYGVIWNVPNNRWEIFLEDQQTNMPIGEKFNVLVIKQ